MDPPVCVFGDKQVQRGGGEWTQSTKQLQGECVTEDTADCLAIRLPCLVRGIADLCWRMQTPKLQKALPKWEAMLGFISMLFFCFADSMAGNKTLKDDFKHNDGA